MYRGTVFAVVVVVQLLIVVVLFQESGLWDIVGGSDFVDETLFMPCGYSLNALVGENHHTIHVCICICTYLFSFLQVTPQPECSYASFETTVQYKDYKVFFFSLCFLFVFFFFFSRRCSSDFWEFLNLIRF